MTTVPQALEAGPVAPPPQSGGDEFGSKSLSQGRQALDRFRRSWVAMSATILFVVIVLASYIAPHFYKWKYNVPDLRPIANSASPGTAGHPLGTDGTGFDLLSQLMRGTQRDFVVMLVSSVVAVVLGIVIGAIAGYYGAIADNVLMRFVDVMLTVPSLVILIVVANNFTLDPLKLGLLLGLFGWMGLSRLVRAQFLSLKEREFIEAAHAMGASDMRIIFRHLVPNCFGTILVFGTIFAALSIVTETSLTFLGYGIRPPDTSLGLLISNGVDAAETRPWLFYYPGVLIVILVLAVNLIGEGIRNAFDPKNNRVRD